MIKLMEPTVVLTVAAQDNAAVAKLLPECEKEYESRMTAATNRPQNCVLHLHESAVLKSEVDCGGVTLESKDGRIVCMNTVSSKLNLVYEQLLPKIRHLLFPTK